MASRRYSDRKVGRRLAPFALAGNAAAGELITAGFNNCSSVPSVKSRIIGESVILGKRMARRRKGMVIKNTDRTPVSLRLQTRVIEVGPGQELPITAEEVRDPDLRDKLQARELSIVRPISEEEEAEIWHGGE